MIVLEYKCKGKEYQYRAIDESIRTAQFVRNKALRYWMDNKGVNKYDLNKYCAVLAKEYPFVDKLNSTARQSSAERAWSSISRFFDNCKKQVKGKKGYPKFKKNARSLEYKHSGWKLDPSTKKHITFTDKKGIGKLKLIGSRDIYFYQPEEIKRVRLVRRADGYYCQFSLDTEVREDVEPSGKAIGIDVGLKFFYADSNGHTEENPRFYRKNEKRLNKLNRRQSKKYRKNKKPQSNNYHKARKRYAKLHLRISRQRVEHAKRLARTVCTSNDCICYEDLQVKSLVRNQHLSKSIYDAGWTQFRNWIEYFGYKLGKITIAVSPNFTSQDCPNCGKITKKSLSTRTHNCSCGYVKDRDVAASINILKKGLSTTGHLGTFGLYPINASGDLAPTLSGEILLEQVKSLNEESPHEA
ncbi:MAG: IS200/IS605 family transposase ISTosp1 [Chroococcopsis gigantea SAG 12.99]|jgi:putative transposase|nr:transposase [Chlorogloea purpurea SAG 13.99]MDV3001380.1 IS200/IS605 family transposase ISTosp1 [Chroococcopsis gigantea SAG 12.99]